MNNIEDILSGLSDQEKEITLSILKEIESKGSSDTLNKLYNDDFEEIPVDINTFIDSPRYAGWMTGNGKNIYPYWRNELNKIFNQGNSYQEVAFTGCLTGDTVIPLYHNGHKTMKELADIGDSLDEYVYSFDNNFDNAVGHLVNAFSTGVKDVYKIVLDDGYEIKATSNHKFVVANGGWKSIDTGLSVDDYLKNYKYYYNGIQSIEYIGKEEVYDLTVERYHNFVLESGVVAHNSIGIGKSSIAIICLAYLLYKLMCLRNPHEYYNIGKGAYIYVVFFNATLTLSQGVAYTKFQSLLQNSQWFLERGTVTGKKYLEYIPNKPIRFVVGSTVEHSLGRDIFCMSGDTVILTHDGLKKLEDISGEYHRVYSMREDGELELSEPALICETKIVNELYEVELEDGSIIRCTGEHRLRLSNEEYKRVDELTTDDELYDI